MTEEITEVNRTPLIPVMRILATVFMIISTALAYTVSELFIEEYVRLTALPPLPGMFWMSIGLIFGLLLIFVSLLEPQLKRYVKYGIAFILLGYFVIRPLVFMAYSRDYAYMVFLSSINDLGYFLAFILLVMPAMLGIYGVWRDSMLATFISATITVSMTAMVIEKDASPFLSALFGVSTLIWVLFVSAVHDFLVFMATLNTTQKNVVVESRRCLLSSATQTLIYLIPFTVLYIIFINFSAVAALLSPPAVAESIEINSIYVYPIALLDLGILLWLIGTAARIPEGRLRLAVRRIEERVRTFGGYRKRGAEEDQAGRVQGE